MSPRAILNDALAALGDRERYEEHEEAEETLFRLKPEDRASVPLLTHCLQDEKYYGRFWVMDTLKRIAPTDSAVFAAIAARSRDSDEYLRGEAITFLGHCGAANHDAAIAALARATRLRPSQDYMGNTVKVFAALVRLAG